MKTFEQVVATDHANADGPSKVRSTGSRVTRQSKVLQRYADSAGRPVSRPVARRLARSRSKTGGKHPFGQLTGQRSRYETALRTGGLR